MTNSYIIVQTVLVPPEVFVGDRAQIRFMLAAAQSDEFSQNAPKTLFITEGDERLGQSGECTLVEARLTAEGNGSFRGEITFIPWKTGTLPVPSVNFGTTEKPFTVEIPPQIIKSLAEKTGTETLKPPVPPMLIPGTTYAVYGAVTAAVLALILLLTALLKIKSVSAAVFSFLARLRMTANYRKLRRELRRLEKKAGGRNAQDFAAALEKLLRSYFERRFSLIFSSSTATECAQLLTEAQAPQSASDAAVFILRRCDYVRFCARSDKGAELPQEERLELICSVRKAAQECENDRI